jgi:phosphoglycerol transferase MdoB-like AlkP superfamily enzyme
MKEYFFKATYPLGLTLFALLLAVYKAVSLTIDMGTGMVTVWSIIGLDMFFLSILFLLALIQSYTRLNWLRRVLGLVLFCLTLIYLVDCFVLLALDVHADLLDIGRYTPEWGVVKSFFDFRVYTAIVLLLISVLVAPVSNPFTRRTGLFLIAVSLSAAGFSVATAPQPLKQYAMLSPNQLLDSVTPSAEVTSYSDAEIVFYAGLKREAVDIPDSKPDVILLVVESLSSINSQRTSAGLDFLVDFDKLAEEGVLFTNFFANHQASEGGLIALLGGFPPMHFPGASPYMFDEFAIQDSVVDEYRKRGYRTEFLTNADLKFIGLDRFLNGLGLDQSRGRDEVEAMRLASPVVQDAPSDAYLYREAMSTIERLLPNEAPFFLTIATTSTHLPYTHPEGGADTPEAVWEWSLHQLVFFYEQLSAIGFFEKGILLVTGDHRQMRPLTRIETERYGASARARVPLLAIGSRYLQGTIDNRFFQQSDLLRKLGKIDKAGVRLSPYPIWVERYNRKYGRIELINNLSVFSEADQGRLEYRMLMPGNRIEWLDEKPSFGRHIETRIHAQRSLHQQRRSLRNLPSAEKH